ncbi:hypothetical protein F2Q70_00005201 [Brassica cretica]|uniref:Uncharacterized protein n=1 Tax=Brassica cretica TaxID=69181 RepID=A0A8S9IZQ3_BRACR|nr:hypothetical protein F2Q70_00005201 [Brassica cretica]
MNLKKVWRSVWSRSNRCKDTTKAIQVPLSSSSSSISAFDQVPMGYISPDTDGLQEWDSIFFAETSLRDGYPLRRRHVSPSFQRTKLLNDSVRLVILSVTKKLRKEHAVAKRLQRIQTNQNVQPASAFFIFISIVMLVVDQDEGPREDEESDTHNVSAVCFQPELPIILTGFEDGTVGIWHATTYESFI